MTGLELRGDQRWPGGACRESHPTARDSGPSTAGAYRGRRILVVDDNSVNRLVAAAHLGRLGCTVDVAIDGHEALKALGRNTYDLVLMDCQMPDLDGLQATRAVRAGEGSGRRTPIVALTASALKGHRETCFAAGMDDYLAKPIGTEDLRRVLDRWLPNAGEAGAGVAGDGPAGPLPAAADAGESARSPCLDPEALAGIRVLEAAGEPGLVGEVLSTFIGTVTTGLPALRDAGEKADWPKLARAAHGLRGSCGIVGARRMADLCAALERAAEIADAEAWRPAHLALEEHWRTVRPEIEAQMPPPAAGPPAE